MIADRLLQQLHGVRAVGVDRWIARCPAHDDARPSLSVREIDGDRVLVHCWTGCEVREVLGAVGLDFDALFPQKAANDRFPRERRPFDARDILSCIAYESLVAAVAAGNLAKGIALTDADRERLTVAAFRLKAAAEAANA